MSEPEKRSILREELKKRFLQELTPSEKLFFIKMAKEAAAIKGYPVCEDLFHYCYFMTLKERIRGISPQGGGGYMRFLLVEGIKDIEEAIKLYGERLGKNKLPAPDPEARVFIEYLSE
ncbi:MAG: hypothetical protein AB1632_11135 [Nitrospirota bacterium]